MDTKLFARYKLACSFPATLNEKKVTAALERYLAILGNKQIRTTESRLNVLEEFCQRVQPWLEAQVRHEHRISELEQSLAQPTPPQAPYGVEPRKITVELTDYYWYYVINALTDTTVEKEALRQIKKQVLDAEAAK